LIRLEPRPIVDVALSGSGIWLAVAQGSQIHLWDARRGERVKTLGVSRHGKPAQPTYLSFTPDGKRLAVGDSGGVVHLCDIQTGESIGTLADGPPLPAAQPRFRAVTALAFSPDGTTLAVGHGGVGVFGPGYDQVVHVWDVRAARVLHRLAHGNS